VQFDLIPKTVYHVVQVVVQDKGKYDEALKAAAPLIFRYYHFSTFPFIATISSRNSGRHKRERHYW